MGKKSQPRAGSLQFWPRKRARKFLPSVNWNALKKENILRGVIAYKVGMMSCAVKDKTANSMTKDKKIVLPVTILEVPSMKIFSVRLYKNNKLEREFLVHSDKELKRKVKLPEKSEFKIEDVEKKLNEIGEGSAIKIIVYSIVKETGVKKTPDLSEIALGGSKEEGINFIKAHLNKEISLSDFKESVVDVRGLTKGKGFAGPVKRHGIGLKSHKTEKGIRKPGSLGPWHPAHVTFRTPMAGQLGMFSRIHYNLKVIKTGKISEVNINPKSGFKHYGNIKTDYIILSGSVQGSQKRQILLTSALRGSKKTAKKNYEFMELR